MVLFNFTRFEPPSVRQARLRDTTRRLTGEVLEFNELFEENLRRFREVEQRQQPAFTPPFQPPPFGTQETGITREMRAQRERDVRAVPSPRSIVERKAQSGEPLTGGEHQVALSLGFSVGPVDGAIRVTGFQITPAQEEALVRGVSPESPGFPPSDIGAPAGEPPLPGIAGRIPGLRTPAELGATIATLGVGGPLIGPATAVTGSAGAFAGGEVAEEVGLPPAVGELVGGLTGGLTGGLAVRPAVRAGRELVGEATQRARLAPELGGPLRGREPAPGFIRLYRGQRSARKPVSLEPPLGERERGRFFSTRKETAESFGPAIDFVDVPEETFRALQAEEAALFKEFPDINRIEGSLLLPPELANQAQPLRGVAPSAPLRGGEEGVQGRLFPDDLHIAKGDPGPPPPRKPKGATPDDPEFRNIQEVALKGEKPPETLIRRHQGALDTAKREAANEVRDNNKTLVEIGLGKNFRGSVVAKTEGSFDELNSLLHNPGAVARGERIVPDNLRPIYDRLRTQTDFEQAARIDFDPDQALVEDYFFRGWQPPEGMFTGEARGSLGRNPGFRLPRVNATYDEMVEAGFKPLFDNPAEQARYSQVMGVKYREQMRLIEDIKVAELALPVVGGPVPKGWRVPKVGPAFEGKPYADGSRVAFTRRWAVPDSLANRLENVYGVTPKLGKGELFGKTVDFQKAVDAVTFTPKRFKLVGSLFQHIDFLSRSHIGAWTGFVDAIRRGQPATAVVRLAKWPQSAVDIVHATFSPNFRSRLAKLAVDDAPLFEGRKISNRMISEAGLSLRDETIFPELDAVIRQVEREPRIVRLGKAPLRALGDLERQWRQGLFEGVYPAAILSDIKNNIGPIIIKQHPEATDAQLAGMIAKASNEVYSTIPASMSIIQNQQARWFLTRFLFSLGENEGLLRSFTGAIRGENAAFFRARLAGTYLGLLALATTTHFATTGKPLPLNRFTPVSKDKFGPFPVGFNTDFASPDLPIKGRGGANIQLDLVMQQDTIFRILNPQSFLSSRTSVPVRALENQRTGKDFFGAPIDTVGPGGILSRTAQLAKDLFAPIGPGQAGLEILRNNVEEVEGLILPTEGRLGTTGIGIQAGGINLRAERTPELLDRIRAEVLRDRGIEESYATIALEDPPLKQEIDDEVEERIGGELEIRGETSRLRGQQTPQSEGFEALEATRERQQADQLADDTKLNSNQWSGDVWREKYADRQREFFASREQIKEDFNITFDDRAAPPQSVAAAIDAYFNVNVDGFTQPDGAVDWDAFFGARDAALSPLSATDRARVVQWLRKFDTPTVTEFRKAQEVVDRVFETPKYKDLTLEQGEEADRILNEDVPNLQTQALREGIELERTDAVHFIIEQGVSDEVGDWLRRRFKKPRSQIVKDILRDRLRAAGVPTDIIRRIVDRPGPKLETLVNPERDNILLENQEILAKFYPDILARQLNREQEAELGETAFAAVQR